MARFDIEARVAKRRGTFAVYLKGAEPIITFLALVGAHQALLRTEDVRIVKSVRNDVNRLVNAEIANQQKTAEAAVGQIQAIEILGASGGSETCRPPCKSLHSFASRTPTSR